MLKFETTTAKDGGAALARTCDTCCSAVYCRADLAFLCSACDARIHAAASPHERLRVCESCERAPAEFVCKADSASLCATCDAEVHSANPLARRHLRVPIKPLPGGLAIRPPGNAGEDEDEAASWLLLNPIKTDDDENGAALFDGEVDEYLDLDEYNSFSEGYNSQQQHNCVPQSGYGSDSDVPMQYHKGKNHSFGMGLEDGYAYPASMSQTVSISSMDIGVVPELTSDVSNSYTRPSKGTIDLFSSPPIQVPTQLSPMDREARVLRYREKKKNRRFEKTIRYASRKAYAETRPRIKGRFAKRRDQQVDVDQIMFSSASLMAEIGYGIVPSF